VRAAAIIPARLDSSRFPRKLLQDLAGLPILAHVARRVACCPLLGLTVVASGDEEILSAMRALGVEVLRTTRELPSGTDRIAEANEQLGAELVVNVQGDEPLVRPGHVEALLGALSRDGGAAASTLRFPLEAGREADRNVVKVVSDARGRALYFSRQALAQAPGAYFKHVGMYAYRRETLVRFRQLGPAPQELAERLEQLRLLDAGLAIALADAPEDTDAVDVPSDLERLRRRMGLDSASPASIP
jgi:3-deoxy-D-manno-octulosonate cytidylyltransferase